MRNNAQLGRCFWSSDVTLESCEVQCDLNKQFLNRVSWTLTLRGTPLLSQTQSPSLHNDFNKMESTAYG